MFEANVYQYRGPDTYEARIQPRTLVVERPKYAEGDSPLTYLAKVEALRQSFRDLPVDLTGGLAFRFELEPNTIVGGKITVTNKGYTVITARTLTNDPNGDFGLVVGNIGQVAPGASTTFNVADIVYPDYGFQELLGFDLVTDGQVPGLPGHLMNGIADADFDLEAGPQVHLPIQLRGSGVVTPPDMSESAD